jgi:oxalate decarboxylase/phosphoglucose isomerase-like protein (cupin superfamily)
MERAEARLRRLAWRSPVESVVSTTVTLDPGQTSTPHVYPDHDVIMVVVSGSADLFWWDARGVIHRVSHEPDQQVCIRRGTRHCAVNSGAVRMVAVQIQATAKGTAGMALPPKMAVGLSAVDSPDGAGAIAAG